MKTESAIGRSLKEERGFTLTEVMVTAIIMIIILFALYSIFDTGMKIVSFGNNKAEAAENARLGLEKMEREIRGAYKVDAAHSPPENYLFFNANGSTTDPPQAMPAANQITFGNDLNGDNKVTCPNPNACEYITYKLTADAVSNTACAAAPCTLKRVNTANATDAGDPLVGNVLPDGLTFTYLKSDATAPANEAEISKVRVSLNVSVDKGLGNNGTQQLTTEIDLRNRQ